MGCQWEGWFHGHRPGVYGLNNEIMLLESGVWGSSSMKWEGYFSFHCGVGKVAKSSITILPQLIGTLYNFENLAAWISWHEVLQNRMGACLIWWRNM
jgi:hypothetical protein